MWRRFRRVDVRVLRDLDGPHKALAISQIGRIVEPVFEGRKTGYQRAVGNSSEFGAQGGVCGHFDHAIALQDCLEVHPRAPDDHRQDTAPLKCLEHGIETFLVIKDAEFLVQVNDVNEMVSDAHRVDLVLVEIFPEPMFNPR